MSRETVGFQPDELGFRLVSVPQDVWPWTTFLSFPSLGSSFGN